MNREELLKAIDSVFGYEREKSNRGVWRAYEIYDAKDRIDKWIMSLSDSDGSDLSEAFLFLYNSVNDAYEAISGLPDMLIEEKTKNVFAIAAEMLNNALLLLMKKGSSDE